VQAGLLKNPVFSLDVRFPDRSPARTYLDIGVAEDFLDVALLPARKRLAAEQFAQAQANVSGQVLALAAEAAKKFYAYQAAAQVAGEYQEIGRAAEAASSAAKSLHSAGNISELEFANQTAAAARAAAAALDATGQAEEAREQVNAVMGLDDAQIQWTAAAAVPEIPAVEIDAGGLEMLAARKRFDLIAARQEVEVQSQKLGLSSQYRFFQNVDVGPNAERETDGQWRVGPAVSVPVPIFDQGQASVARARAIYEQSRERLAGLEADVRSEVRAARGRMMNARARVILYRDQVLPAEAEAARQGQLQYNGMYIGVFQLLQIRHDQIEARREYIQSLASYWSARTDLESAVGGQLPGADQGVKP
jgi:cobalt-zinc-cadmium efflux system outer membrane protein